MVKIYTKRGDLGLTDLKSGERVRKDSLRIMACGDVDELNSFIGFARVVNKEWIKDRFIERSLEKIQNELFVLGADLAVKSKKGSGEKILNNGVDDLERKIDELDAKMPALKNFVLPAGGRVAVTLHVARTVCRRAERVCVSLAKREKISGAQVKYLNRLGDFLFVLARWGNKAEGVKDEVWKW